MYRLIPLVVALTAATAAEHHGDPADGIRRHAYWRGAGATWEPLPTTPDEASSAAAKGRSVERHQVGAAVPFVTIEAESAATTGRVVRLEGRPTDDSVSPALEASGRAYVELTHGQRLDVTVTRPANTIVIRHCIPDAATGGGLDATLTVLVNGIERQRLALTSRHSWMYGPENGQANDPARGHPKAYWDESWAFINDGINVGDLLSLAIGEGDDAAWYAIDLIDLEDVAPPGAQPPGSVSVADFGGVPDDDGDDTQAIRACVAEAAKRGVAAWIPAGTWLQSEKIVLDGVTLRGAGMWHTHIIGTTAGDDFDGCLGFRLSGDGTTVSGMMLRSAVHDSRGVRGGKPFTGRFGNTRNWLVEDVWIMHTNVGFWLSGCDDGVIRRCRVRGTYADGINLNRGSSRNVIEECHVRGCGDDGIAVLSEIRDPPSCDNVIRRNTVSAIWWGHNLDIAGGSGHVVEDNLLADNSLMGVLTINLPHSYPMHPLTNTIMRRNHLVRGGGNGYRQQRGAAWFFTGSTSATGIVFTGNRISDAIFSGIHLTGGSPLEIAIIGNRIESPGTDAIRIGDSVPGSGIIRDNPIVNLASDGVTVRGPAVGKFIVDTSDSAP